MPPVGLPPPPSSIGVNNLLSDHRLAWTSFFTVQLCVRVFASVKPVPGQRGALGLAVARARSCTCLFCATFFSVGLQHGSGTDQLKRLGPDTPLKCLPRGGQISAPSPQVTQYGSCICILINHIYWAHLQTENTTITRKQMLDSPVSRSAPSFHPRMSSAGQGSRCWRLSAPNQITANHRSVSDKVGREDTRCRVLGVFGGPCFPHR